MFHNEIKLILYLQLYYFYSVNCKLFNVTDGNSTSITDFGKTIQVNSTYVNFKNPQKSINSSTGEEIGGGGGEELVETTCHIFTEKLVATAKASVSSAFENLCDSKQLNVHIDELETKFIGELNAIKQILVKMEANLEELETKLIKEISSKKFGNNFFGY